MKHLYVVIFLILFQVSWIPAKDGDEPTTSGDAQGTKEEDQPATPSNVETPPQESSWYSRMQKPVLDEEERRLLDAVEFDGTRGSRSTSRSSSLKSDDDSDDGMFSLSDEDKRTEPEDLHDILKTREKIKEKADKVPKRKKYWPKNLPHIGSMTPYRFLLDTVPKNLEYFRLPNPKERKLAHKKCSVVRTWNLFRHGIRYPSKETSHGMRTRLRNLKESILLKIYENPEIFSSTTSISMDYFLKLLDTWDVVKELSEGLVHVSNESLNKRKTKAELAEELAKLTPLERATREKNRGGADEQIEEAKTLTPIGRKEMEAMGERFKERFGELLKDLDPALLLFKFTDCQRTRESAVEVYSAMYKRPADNDYSWHEPVDAGDDGKDPLLKYDALCAHWKKNYKKSDLNMHQLDKLITGNYVKNVLKGLTGILKFPKKAITFNDGRLFYESCAFEKAWEIESPWCELMSDEYLSVYEYLEDYEFYKNDGPDNDMNLGVGCFLFNDMVDRLIGDVRKDEHGKISWDLHLEKDGTDQGTVQSTEPEGTDQGTVQSTEPEGTDQGTVQSTEPEETDQGTVQSTEPEGTDQGTVQSTEPEETDTPKSKTSGTDSVEEIIDKLSAAKEKSESTDKKAKKAKREKKPIKKATFYFTHLTAILKFITHLKVHVDKEHLTPYNFEQMTDRKWRSARIGAFGTNISFVLMKCDKSYYILALHQERPLILPNCHDELCPLDIFLKTYQDSIFNCDYEEMCEKYKHRMFSRSMSPHRGDSPDVRDLDSLSFSSKSSFGSSRRPSFRITKEFH